MEYDAETGFYYVSSRYYDPEIGRFINADGYVSTGQGVLGNNMFAYCGNNPINRKDPTGELGISALIVGAVVTLATLVLTGSSKKDKSEPANIQYSKQKPNFIPNPNKRKGSENRQPSNERERNVGHPNGEEHSRVPKGNNGIRRSEAIVGIAVATVVIVVLVADDATGVGTVDDVALAPTAVIWWDYAMVLW